MPIFVYQCKECSKEHSFFGSYNDIKSKEDSYRCSAKDCNGQLVRKVSSSTFSLSGKGWFKDGYS